MASSLPLPSASASARARSTAAAVLHGLGLTLALGVILHQVLPSLGCRRRREAPRPAALARPNPRSVPIPARAASGARYPRSLPLAPALAADGPSSF